jgi:CheY-like chemotaxis protein
MLAQRAGDHEDDVEALVLAAETQMRHAEAAFADARRVTEVGAADLRSALGNQLERSISSAETARHLCVAAHQQHVAACRFLSHLESDPDTDEPRAEPRPRSDAVLVVDDYPEIRELVSRVLQRAGFVVRTAANGLEGLLAAYEMRPGVIVMDVTMPVLDGIEATRLIKATEATRHARVIAYSGNAALDNNLIQTLFAAVLPKPAPPDLVLATVRHVATL